MSSARRLPVAASAAVALAAAALGVSNAFYTVGQSRQAVLLRFGAPVQVVNGAGADDPGLYVKWPFADHAVRLPKGVQSLQAPTQTLVAADKTSFRADALLAYRIVDPLRFYRAFGADPAAAAAMLGRLAGDGVAGALNGAPRAEILGGGSDAAMARALEATRKAAVAAGYGVQMLDLRLAGVALPADETQAALHREQAELTARAAQLRADGEAARQQAIGAADRDAAELRGEGEADALRARGQGDADRAAILGAAYAKDPAFAGYLRRLDAYDGAMNPDNTTLVLSGDNAFLREFQNGPSREGPAKGR